MLGVDISSTAVKLLELSQISGRYRIEAYAVEPLAPGVVEERDIKDIEAVGDAIKKALRRSKFTTRHAAVAVSGSTVITKIIQLDASLSEDEMEVQIELEADQYIPYPIDEVRLDFDVQEVNPDNPAQVNVLLAAAKAEDIYGRVDALEYAGLTVDVVDVEAYAIERAYRILSAFDEDDQAIEPIASEIATDDIVAIVDIGASVTTLCVLKNGVVIYHREHTFGGRQLTEEIQRRYNLSLEEAGVAKKQANLPDDYVPEVLNPFRETVCQQVKRSLQVFYSSSSYSQIDKMILAGGTSMLSGIADLVESRVGVPTRVANPFASMSLSPAVSPQNLTNDASALVLCCGLAMRSFEK